MSTADTLEHLSRAAKLVDGDSRTNKLLHSYYLSRIQSLAPAGNFAVQSPPHSSCSKCLLPFNDSKNYTMSIKPRRIRKVKYKKLVDNFACKSQDKLSRLKKNFGKNYEKLFYNVAEITCKLCNSKSESNIRFGSKEKSKPKCVDPPVVKLSDLELVKSKKRKRDKNAGLKLSEKPTTAWVEKRKIETKPAIHPTVKPSLGTSGGNCKREAKAQLTNVVQLKTKGNSVKKQKNSSTEKKMNKISSAQKQRKGILLLANVLKMNDQRQQENSSQMKLSRMFK